MRTLYQLVPGGHRHHGRGCGYRRRSRRAGRFGIGGEEMSTSSMASLLVEQGFFATVPENVAATIGELTSERKAGIDELLFRQGDRADHFYLVKSGLIAVEMYAPGRDAIVVEQIERAS